MLGLTLSLGLAAQSASPATRYAEISGSTAAAENGCPAWVLETNDDDCSYNGGKPFELGNSQWVGPVFSAGYYAPGGAPLAFSNSVLPPGPVTAPAPELPLGGKTGIPIANGFVSIDDRDTPAGIDDVIGGTLEFGAFERNVSVNATGRVIESIERVIHRISPVRVSGATANGSGGYDYVVAEAGNAPAFPDPPLGGTTTFGGGFSDVFPSEVGSQSTTDVADFPFWDAAGANGLATLDGTTAVLGTRSTATVWGYSCDDGVSVPVGCLTNSVNWDGDSRASFSNVLLRISTDSSGNVTSADAFLVGEADLSSTVINNDSWWGTTLSFTGTATEATAAFDDRAVLSFTASRISVTNQVLANDLIGKSPLKNLEILTGPADGTAIVGNTVNTQNVIQYTKGSSTPEGEQVIVYQVTDAEDVTATAELHVLVTDTVECLDDSATGQRDAPVTVDVTANDSGFDLPPVTVAALVAPDDGTTVVNPDRTITYTPPADTGGVFSITYTLNDGANRPVNCDVSIQIPALPQAVDDTFGMSVDTAGIIDVLANDLEITDTPLTLTVVAPPTHGTATPDSPGVVPKITYTPTAGYTGPDSLTYTVTDADSDVSSVATVTITVFGPPENDLPSCTDDSRAVDRGSVTTIDVLANDTGLNAAPLTVEIIEVFPADAGSATVNPDNTITFTAPGDAGGEFFIAYSAREALNNQVQCTVTVRVDDLPIANDDDLDGVNFGQLLVVRILNNDTGLSDVPIELEITQQPAYGTLSVCDAPSALCPGFTTGSLPFVTYRYDDASAYPAADIFQYRLRDDGGDASANATVIATPRNILSAENDPDGFLTVPTDFRTASGFPVTLNVLANDGGLLRTPLTVSLVSTEAGGTAVVNAGNTVTFTAFDDFTGFTGFTYRVTDADGKSDIATALVFVFPAPVTDSGGSSFDWSLTAILWAGIAARRRRRNTLGSSATP